MVKTGAVFRLAIDELMLAAYYEALEGMGPEQIERGFRRARRLSRFFPTPIEIREHASAEYEEERRNLPALKESEPHCSEWSEEERREFAEELRKACGQKAMPKEISEREWKDRVQKLKKQADGLLKGKAEPSQEERQI